MSEIIPVNSIVDARSIATTYGFEMNEGQGRPALFDLAKHVKSHGVVLDFSGYSSKRPAGVKRVGGVKVEALVTVKASVNGDDREIQITNSEVRGFTGDVGKRGKTSQNSYVMFAAAQWNVDASELSNVRLEREVNVPRVVAVATVAENPVAETELVAEAPKAARKGKSRSKATKAVSEDLSGSEPVDLDAEQISAE